MSWQEIKTGDSVICAQCSDEVTVVRVLVCDGGIGFELGCGHRNGFCEKCDRLVPDFSNNDATVLPGCSTCWPPED